MSMPSSWAVAAALAYALHPGPIAAASVVLSETLFATVLVAAVAALAIGVSRDRLVLTSLGGVCVGLAALCRPVALLLPLVFIAALYRSGHLRRPTLHCLLILGGSALVILPWAARCSRVAHRT